MLGRRNKLIRFCVYIVMLLGSVMGGVGCSVSDRQIVEQADQFHNGLQPAVIRDPELDRYINTVGQRIIAAARDARREGIAPEAQLKDEESEWMFSDKMKFHFVNSKTLNAFTTGGEHMYIYTGLLQECRTEDELAAVMAHEYAHVYGRHVQKGTQRQYGMLGAALAAAAAGYVAGGKESGAEYASLAGGGAMMAGQLVGSNFTRKDEAEADKYGFVFYTRAGWDPDRFDDFFQTMIDKGYDKGPEFLSDHPSLANRVKDAKARADKLGPNAEKFRQRPVASGADFQRIQRRAQEVGRNMPDDKSLEQTQELLQALPRSCLTPAIREDQKEAQRNLQRDLERAERQQKAQKARSNG
jgi:predicted Zn-dependent protease